MPELPEVEVVRRGLEAHAVGRTITAATFTGARSTRRHVAGPSDLADRLAGARIEAADRRGKFLWLVVAAPGQAAQALSIHLGMSGQMLVADPGASAPRHTHARLALDDGRELRFVDQRTFGGLHAEELGEAVPGHPGGIPASVGHIAPDPFEPLWDRDAVVADLHRRRAGLKRLLLTQTIVSGIGNIYADEALWRARVHGERPASTLTRPVLARTLDAAREVMGEALEQGGTSFDALYVNVNGQSGYFDRRLAVYGQQGRPCPRCGAAVVRAQFMNRSSHWCPRCQTAPRGLRQA